MELSPISASLGAMGSLPRKLDDLLATGHWALSGVVMDEIEELTADLHILCNILLKLSNAHDPPPTVRFWMKEVRELSYDVEDCADQFVLANVMRRAKIHRAAIRKIIITRLKISRLPERRKWRLWITDKVAEFRTRAQDATQRYWRYKFGDCASNPRYSSVGRELPTVYAQPGDLVGIEGPMNELEQWLTDGEEQLKVISIVGVGGVGKTTLAQKLWATLKGQFLCRAFVRTAQKPDMRGILKNILLQVRPHQLPDHGEMHHLIHDLREYLQDKRYFVIIDDLWAASVWDVVSRAFPEGNCCSRIVTTTEIMEVALACCDYCPKHICKMETLSDDDSEKLLLERIAVSGNQIPQQLDDVLPQITRNCGGLPLAIIIVASLLVSQPEKLEQWGHTQNSFGSIFGTNPTMEGIIRQILSISFNGLPYYLKTCLLYLSTYPEGCLFLKDDLVKLWVAEGFIHAKEWEDMEELAGLYFDDLVNAGLIQVMDINYNYKLPSYSVHHMVLDFITYKSIEENFITVVDYSQTTIPLTDKVRRLALHFGSATHAATPASTRLSNVRSLFFFGLFNCMPSFMVFKLLRVLILQFWGDPGNSSFNLTGLCELVWLRYLQVSCNVTIKLPDQVESLEHLETLEINARVCAVPPDIVRLSRLSHLQLRGGTIPSGIECMLSLRTLKYFDLVNSSVDNLRGLGELANLRDLCLTYSSSVPSECLKRNLIALASSLGKLCNLKSLTLASGTAPTVVLFDGSVSMSSAPVFLERLKLLPPICMFSRLPKWIGQFRKLCILEVAVRELLTNDINSITGLPSLTVLSLCVQTAPEQRIVFNDGAFPILKYFKFRCGVLCMSFMVGAMPNIRRIKLRFNAHVGEKYGNMLAGIEHLLNLQDIAGQIGAATESDRRAAELAIKGAISKHPRCPRFNLQLVDPIKEECRPSAKQHERQEEGSSGENFGVLEEAKDMNKHAADRALYGYELPGVLSSVATHDLSSGTRAAKVVSALITPKLQDGYVAYPCKKMSDLLCMPMFSISLPSPGVLSMLVIPKALEDTCQYESFVDTSARATAWLYFSQSSGIPIRFVMVQSEEYLTKISGEASATVNSGPLSGMANLAKETPKAARLFYNLTAVEMLLEIQLQEGDLRLGFAVSRTEEGFIYISSVAEDDVKDSETPSTRSGLRDLFNQAREASKLLIISRVSNEKVLPWEISGSGAIRCFDLVSLGQYLSFHRHALHIIQLHLLMSNKPFSPVRRITRGPKLLPQSALPQKPRSSNEPFEPRLAVEASEGSLWVDHPPVTSISV